MRFLIDNALPPRMADELCAAGYDAIHVRTLGIAAAIDDVIFDRATADNRIIVSEDTDFGTILATRNLPSPSVILFRRRFKSVESLLPLMVAHLPSLEEDIRAGAVVVFEDARIRIRRLPFKAAGEC